MVLMSHCLKCSTVGYMAKRKKSEWGRSIKELNMLGGMLLNVGMIFEVDVDWPRPLRGALMNQCALILCWLSSWCHTIIPGTASEICSICASQHIKVQGLRGALCREFKWVYRLNLVQIEV